MANFFIISSFSNIGQPSCFTDRQLIFSNIYAALLNEKNNSNGNADYRIISAGLYF